MKYSELFFATKSFDWKDCDSLVHKNFCNKSFKDFKNKYEEKVKLLKRVKNIGSLYGQHNNHDHWIKEYHIKKRIIDIYKKNYEDKHLELDKFLNQNYEKEKDIILKLYIFQYKITPEVRVFFFCHNEETIYPLIIDFNHCIIKMKDGGKFNFNKKDKGRKCNFNWNKDKLDKNECEAIIKKN